METYWLTPITRSEPVVLGAERVALSAEEGEALRGLFAETHSWLLPSFKLALLIGEDDACGYEDEDGELSLRQEGDIPLEGVQAISHCATAFVERLLAPEKALALASSIPSVPRVETVREWWRSGFLVMLLKEEG
jgi:hypothetical protein